MPLRPQRQARVQRIHLEVRAHHVLEGGEDLRTAERPQGGGELLFHARPSTFIIGCWILHAEQTGLENGFTTHGYLRVRPADVELRAFVYEIGEPRRPPLLVRLQPGLAALLNEQLPQPPPARLQQTMPWAIG